MAVVHLTFRPLDRREVQTVKRSGCATNVPRLNVSWKDSRVLVFLCAQLL